MSHRPGYSWLRGLIVIVVLALPAQAASQPPVLAIADPTQRALFDQLFLEAQGPHPSFARDLLPGRADEHLAWFPLQYLVPLAYSGSASGAAIPGYPIATDGAIQTPPIRLGLAQGTETAAAALGLSGSACYLGEGITDVAAYSVDLATGQFSNVSGTPFATDGIPDGIVVEPSGRFLYVANSGGTVTEYSINIATRALTKIGTMPTNVSHPGPINATRQCVFVADLIGGGYDVFAINPANGTLSSVPGSPFGAKAAEAATIARTPDGNFVYFGEVSFEGEIDGFFVDPGTCALTPVPSSPFSGTSFGVLGANPDVTVLYSAGSGLMQAFTIDPASGSLSPLGAALVAGGLTNVKVTITVTDTQTGQSHQYDNPAQTTFQPVQDTGTFKTCP